MEQIFLASSRGTSMASAFSLSLLSLSPSLTVDTKFCISETIDPPFRL